MLAAPICRCLGEPFCTVYIIQMEKTETAVGFYAEITKRRTVGEKTVRLNHHINPQIFENFRNSNALC